MSNAATTQAPRSLTQIPRTADLARIPCPKLTNVCTSADRAVREFAAAKKLTRLKQDTGMDCGPELQFAVALRRHYSVQARLRLQREYDRGID